MSTRARQPDRSSTVRRDDVSVAYDVYGAGPTTVLLLPTWSLVHSGVWKGQVPYLARHFRVVTFDGRGNGRSSTPRGAAAYADDEFAADTVAVMDATDTRAAVLVGLSAGVRWAVQFAAENPDRALGVFGIDPAVTFDVEGRDRQLHAFEAPYSGADWRAMYNREFWVERDFAAFREAFTEQVFSEPHSSQQLEDSLEFQESVTPQMLVDTTLGRFGTEGATYVPISSWCERVRCPVSIVHGSADRIVPPERGERLAELTGGSFTLLEGSGHSPNARDPVRVNLLIRDFVERVTPATVRRRSWTRARERPRRVLYLSSPIGLGHVRRDLAIVEQLRQHQPDLVVDWLTQAPVTAVLAAEGERVHPASSWLASEVSHLEGAATDHDLHAFAAYRRMDEILLHNFHVFNDVVDQEAYDLVVGDEAWDLDYFLHENPELKRQRYAWFTDFVGFLPMPDGGADEAALVADYNAEMLEQRERHRGLRDASILVGNPDDVVADRFGPDLPVIRDWVAEHFAFSGYVTGFRPVPPETVRRLRAGLRLRPEDTLCVVTVGGTAVGAPLLRRVLDTVPIARRLRPDLHFLVVTGPRIDPRSLPHRKGVRLRGYLPRLYEHLAACDVAVVQGGLTTCMELAAARRPFLYVPLEHHFEQQFHVRHRLERYGAGRHIAFADAANPDYLANALVNELAAPVQVRPVETDGAERAGRLLAELL